MWRLFVRWVSGVYVASMWRLCAGCTGSLTWRRRAHREERRWHRWPRVSLVALAVRVVLLVRDGVRVAVARADLAGDHRGGERGLS
eukprot:5886857-Prymnesium_polylepis.1